ncbi:PAS domain-containing sensor histidine kinase [Methanococcoides burtonii]|uniref:histidine kinase n=1 Tax=Methanococcoides burtonii (strain DSM 6242 / NBRC 107633 / OCM 468 / ACE-M) TaxID=259564 RepID=Q12YT4_METBU|nr:HAMP domain-containing sensor histidine kinase [Methanococcoides burtonii]ABE51392.1 Signal transduction histidine kinase [Methanococcoides burtonii DSM 6242]
MLENDLERLRKSASKKLTPLDNYARFESFTKNDIIEIVEELRIHQIELEIQNEELKTSQIELLAQKEAYFTLFNKIPVGYVLLDVNASIIRMNETFSKMIFKEIDKVLFKGLSDFIYDLDKQIFLSRYRAFFENPTNKKMEIRFNKNVGLIYCELTGRIEDSVALTSSLNLNSSKLLLLAITDISDRKMAEISLLKSKDILENASRIKSNFIGNVSHELRTPLNSIIGFSHILKENNENNLTENQLKYCSNVEISGKHLLALINDVLDISKIESGEARFEPELFKLNLLIHEVVESLAPFANKKSIELEMTLKHKNIGVHADRTKIKQILLNLLNNSIKFTPACGKIMLTVGVDEENINISISDNGIGIAKYNYDRIFEPFNQADMLLTKQYEGTGLGLSIAKKYVEMHKGQIWVKSELGVGTTFNIKIPIIAKNV